MTTNNKEEKQLSFREEWIKFYETFSMHGLHFICEANGIRRLFWFLLVCCSFALSVYLFQGVISDYLRYKTMTVNEEQFKVDKVEFPTVTICNMNSVSRKNLQKNNVSEEDVVRLYRQLQEHSVDLNDSHTRDLLEAFQKINVTSHREFVDHFELAIKDLLEDGVVRSITPTPCLFDHVNCSVASFTPVIARDTGKCEQFNSYHQKGISKVYATNVGIGSGLHLFMNIHSDDVLIERVPYRGLGVYVHPYGTPFDSTRSHFIPVQPGTLGIIHVKMSNFELLPPPYPSSCVEKKPYRIFNSSVYTKPMCEADCFLKEYKDFCGCVPIQLAHYEVDPVCDLLEFNCTKKFEAIASKVKRICSSQCPLKCNYSKFQVASEQITIRSKSMVTNIMKLPNWNLTYSETEQYVRNNIVGLDISFSDISFMKTTLLPSVTWTALLGSIGGNIGLCLGASLVSFVEVFTFAFDMIWKAYVQRKKE